MKAFHIYSLIALSLMSACGISKDAYNARKLANTPAKSQPANSKDPNRAAAYASSPKYVYTPKSTLPSKDRKPVQIQSSKGTKAAFITPIAIDRQQFVAHAKTYQGIPYLYGSTDPSKGLDCSGFVYNVFLQFGIQPPRSTKGYMQVGKEISIQNVKIGDILLFTGRDNVPGEVGHMGIVVETKPVVRFIHAASSKQIGVIISDFKGYYVSHFIKAISVLK